MHRRRFLAGTGAVALFAGQSSRALAAGSSMPGEGYDCLDDFFSGEMSRRHIPGLSACLLDRDRMLWQKSYGMATLDPQAPMSADHIQNIASISKTFTTLAALQQVEAGTLSLDVDVNEYLPFSLRHPGHPDRPITLRMLMHHTSTLRDGQEYARQYACGDPKLSLRQWVHSCYEPGGAFYDAQEFFAPWGPGDQYEYSNVAFGLMGYLVEIASGTPLPDYCQREIFAPLGMDNSGWLLAEVDLSTHLTPYSWVENGSLRGPSWGGIPLGVIGLGGVTPGEPLADGFQANCIYNHPNYPDGFLRTSLNQLALWARLWLNDGRVGDRQMLKPATVAEMFTARSVGQVKDTPDQGLTWHLLGELDGEAIWGHSGGDPGVNTMLMLARGRGLAAIMMCNSDGVDPWELAGKILETGLANT